MPSKSTDKKSMDITPPGKTPAEPASRPIIAGKSSMVTDPMVKSEEVEAKPAEDNVLAQRAPKVIQPVGDDSASKEEVPAPKATEVPTKSAEDLNEEAVVEAVVDQATADQKKQNELTDEDKALQEKVKSLVESKKYFVPIGQATRRKHNQRALIAFAVFLVVLVGGFLVLDAGVVKSPIELPFHIIK